MTQITRRELLKLTGVATGGLLLPAGTAQAAGDIPIFPLHKQASQAATICPYCSVGCGLLVATLVVVQRTTN
jgi:anaerobic selenocysteine-containing dehydrogenase